MLLRDLLLPTYLCLGLVSFGASAQKLKAIYEWKYVDYLWDTEADRTEAIQSGDYNFTQAVIIDSDVAEDGRVFVTVIRGKGVPASLTTISDKSGDGGPLLRPYPNWSWARKGDCNSITSVYRVAIDECNRLWVMDNGKISGTQVCPAQLLAFDLKTDRLLKRVKIPDNIAQNSTTGQGLLITPIVETEGPRCKRTFVYIADVQGYALVVYDGNSVWRLNSSVYVPQKSAADVEIAGETFHLADGVLGMALSPKRQRIFGPPESRYLVFRPYASYDMVAAKTTNLRNSRDGSNVNYNIASGVLPSQAVAMAFSSQGVLFFGLNKEMALGCWNMNKPLTQQNIILADQNSITEQFASGLKVLPKRVTRRSEKIWMVTNRYQKVAQGTQDFSEINYRILTGSVDDVLANTRCDPKLGFFGWKY